jgi:YtkA-like
MLLASMACATAAASACVPSLAHDSAPVEPRVTLELTRAGFEYRWEYRVSAQVHARENRRPLSGLRIVARGTMDAPGHHMTAGPTRLRGRGRGVYDARVAFYMPGEWRITVTVAGRGVASSTMSFDLTLK